MYDTSVSFIPGFRFSPKDELSPLYNKVANMADTKVSKTGAFRVPAPTDVELPLDNERVFEYERRIFENHYKRGSRYYPFNIEHKRWERQRLAIPMTAEDRFLRRQWFEDQKLAFKDVKQVPIKSYNIFRRIYRAPWDVLEAGMAKTVVSVNLQSLKLCKSY